MAELPEVWYAFRGCRVVVKPAERYIGTIFPDGAVAHARPNFRAEDYARAVALGYGAGDGAVWEMNVEHELLHTLIAELLFDVPSPVLWAAAHGTLGALDHDTTWHEESRVLAAQRLLRTGAPQEELPGVTREAIASGLGGALGA